MEFVKEIQSKHSLSIDPNPKYMETLDQINFC